MDEPTDAELIARSIAGGDDFSLVYERHVDAVYSFIGRRYGPGKAEEITNETFRIAFSQRGTYDRERPDARSWLMGIARNRGLEELRREVKERRAWERASAEPPPSDGRFEAVDDRLHAAWASPIVAAVVNALPSGERDVLLLFAWKGLSYRQIAIELGIPVGTVRSRINSARQKIAEVLLGEEKGPASSPRPPRGSIR